MRIQRHHLIEEAKADLDRTYEAVKQAENSLITLDVEFGKKISAVKKANGAQMPEKIAGLLAERDEKKNILDIKELYMLEKAALERFSVLSAAFSTVFAHPDEESVALALGNTVFRPGEYIKVGPDVDRDPDRGGLGGKRRRRPGLLDDDRKNTAQFWPRDLERFLF